jgi:FMN phosphatase YigB (HAD superfamily)
VPYDLDALKMADLVAEDFYTEENGGIPIRDRAPEDREAFRLRYTALWLEAAGMPHDEATVRAVRRAHVAELEAAATRANYLVYDDVIPALRRLRDAGVKRALISNADADVTDLCTRMEFAHELNLIVTSAVVGWEKPDVRTFRAASTPSASNRTRRSTSATRPNRTSSAPSPPACAPSSSTATPATTPPPTTSRSCKG